MHKNVMIMFCKTQISILTCSTKNNLNFRSPALPLAPCNKGRLLKHPGLLLSFRNCFFHLFVSFSYLIFIWTPLFFKFLFYIAMRWTGDLSRSYHAVARWLLEIGTSSPSNPTTYKYVRYWKNGWIYVYI